MGNRNPAFSKDMQAQYDYISHFTTSNDDRIKLCAQKND